MQSGVLHETSSSLHPAALLPPEQKQLWGGGVTRGAPTHSPQGSTRDFRLGAQGLGLLQHHTNQNLCQEGAVSQTLSRKFQFIGGEVEEG